MKEIVNISRKINKKIDKFETINPVLTIKKEGKKKKLEEEKPHKLDSAKFLPLEDVASSSPRIYDYGGDGKLEACQETRLENITQEAVEEYLEQYLAMSQNYVTEHLVNSDVIDKNYGPVYDSSNSSWLLGYKWIDFDTRTDDIIVDERRFKGISELYQLIFYHNPTFTEEDKQSYKNLLEVTGAHKETLGRLKSSTSYKYREIIRPLFKSVQRKTVKRKTSVEVYLTPIN